jgi:hypothetical protein
LVVDLSEEGFDRGHGQGAGAADDERREVQAQLLADTTLFLKADTPSPILKGYLHEQ